MPKASVIHPFVELLGQDTSLWASPVALWVRDGGFFWPPAFAPKHFL